MTPLLSPLERLLFWDFERGSLAYDLLVLVLLSIFWLGSGHLADPMVLP